MEYDRKHGYCNPENMKNAIFDILNSMTTENGVKKFISDFKKTYISPSYRTVNDFINGVYETEGLTVLKIANIVKQQLAGLA